MAIDDNPRFQLRGNHRQLMVRREEFVESAAGFPQRLGSVGRVNACDRLARHIFQAHIFGAADCQDPAFPCHAHRTYAPHLEGLLRDGRFRM